MQKMRMMQQQQQQGSAPGMPPQQTPGGPPSQQQQHMQPQMRGHGPPYGSHDGRMGGLPGHPQQMGAPSQGPMPPQQQQTPQQQSQALSAISKQNKIAPVAKPAGLDPLEMLKERENRFVTWQVKLPPGACYY